MKNENGDLLGEPSADGRAASKSSREERTKRLAISAEPTTFSSELMNLRSKKFPKTYA